MSDQHIITCQVCELKVLPETVYDSPYGDSYCLGCLSTDWLSAADSAAYEAYKRYREGLLTDVVDGPRLRLGALAS